ncbi:MAG: hypothetical protein LBV72_17675 [Tannerella sp.]|jgi:hypothetical protein|nr:hypothetical protein [Tannerella sp.]
MPDASLLIRLRTNIKKYYRMKINKDLAEALLMLSLIILVLVSTTDFDNPSTKTMIMASLGVSAGIMGVFRILGARQEKKEGE